MCNMSINGEFEELCKQSSITYESGWKNVRKVDDKDAK